MKRNYQDMMRFFEETSLIRQKVHNIIHHKIVSIMFSTSNFKKMLAVGQRQDLPPVDPEGYVPQTRAYSNKNRIE